MGMIFKAPGAVIYAICGLWGLFITLHIVSEIGGTILVVIALFLAPVVFFLAPFYAALWHGDWFPLFFNYGATLVGGLFLGIGQMIDDRR
jgi:hypothetical protein